MVIGDWNWKSEAEIFPLQLSPHPELLCLKAPGRRVIYVLRITYNQWVCTDIPSARCNPTNCLQPDTAKCQRSDGAINSFPSSNSSSLLSYIPSPEPFGGFAWNQQILRDVCVIAFMPEKDWTRSKGNLRDLQLSQGFRKSLVLRPRARYHFSCLKLKPTPFGWEKSFSRRACNEMRHSLSSCFPPARPNPAYGTPPSPFLPLYGHTKYENPTAEETGLCGFTWEVKRQLLGFPIVESLKANWEGAPFPSIDRLRMRFYHQ